MEVLSTKSSGDPKEHKFLRSIELANNGRQEQHGKSFKFSKKDIKPIRVSLTREYNVILDSNNTSLFDFYHAEIYSGSADLESKLVMDTSLGYSWVSCLSKKSFNCQIFDQAPEMFDVIKPNKFCNLMGDVITKSMYFKDSSSDKFLVPFLYAYSSSCDKYPDSFDYGGIGLKLDHGSIADNFAFWFNPSLESSQRGAGELMLNGYDQNYMGESKFVYFPLASSYEWKINIDCIILAGSKSFTVGKKKTGLIFDSSESSFRGPTDQVDKIYKALKAKLDPETKLWLTDCKRDSWPTMRIMINKKSIDIPGDYYIGVFVKEDVQYCYVNIKAWSNKLWSAGTLFMMAYYTHFDGPNRRIGLVPAKDLSY